MKTFTRIEMLGMIEPEVRTPINHWLERGSGVAVYRNEDLGSRQLGQRKFVSYGDEHSFIEDEEPPIRLPDTPTDIHWRYQLEGTYKGDVL